MGFIEKQLQNVPLPKMAVVRQHFPRPVIDDIAAHIDSHFSDSAIRSTICGKKHIAIAVGSRGIANLPAIVQRIIFNLRQLRASPFIIPAMGSHGGATAEGQKKILASIGITEQDMDAPIRSSMETLHIGTTGSGLPVYLDKHAGSADGIIVINKIKPHVGFRGDYECGLIKMIAVGAGKQKGAEACHAAGFGQMANNIRDAAEVVIARKNILLGVGILENAYNEICQLAVLPPDDILRKEPELLKEARRLAPGIPFATLDVLIIDEIGKNIAGTGMDTNVVGRYHTPYAWGGPDITKIIVLDLTAQSHGNANGIGIADFTTRNVYQKFSFEQTYPNSLTSTVQNSIKIPMVLENDRQAIAAAIRTCNRKDPENARMLRIKNTKELEYFSASESLEEEIMEKEGLTITTPFQEISFNENGEILPAAYLAKA